ncbi:MAG TPA: GntR family transcriptional regulator [Opitutaceae bacterium]|nr:GntR family transcriptional regulator [Opitutaceae bacterium]
MIPRYQRLRLELDAYLAHLPIGAKIMTEHQLADKFSVSRVTARKALEQLRQDGTLISVPGRGTFLEKTVVHSRNGAAKSQFIALLVPSGQTTKIGEIIEGAEKTAAQRGYQMVISHDHDDPKLQIAQLRKLALTQVAGIMLFPDRFVSERAEFLALLEDLKRRNLPVVLLDRYLPNLDLPCVMTDNVQGMYELTEHLICCGRRRLALLGFWASNTVHMARRKGFIEALRDHKLPSHPVKEGNIPGAKDFFRAAHDVVAGWVAGKTAAELPFDAIVCMFDLLAYGAYTALQAVGLRVPEDVALVGYDNLDSEMYRTMGLELTSVQQPLAAEGSAAAELLIDLVEGKSNGRRSSHVLLPPKLVVRTSCGSALQ